MRHFCLAYRTNLPDLLLFLFPAVSQFCHDLFIQLCMEQFPEDHLFIIRSGPQKFHKFPLGNHCHLHELILGKTDDLLQLFVRLFLRIFRAVRHKQCDRSALFFHTVSPFQRPHVPRYAPDGIYLPAFPVSFRKNQLHKRLHSRFHKLALEFCPALFIGTRARLSVKSKHHGVKDRRLSGPRISSDQKQVLIRPFKINGRLFPIGAKRLHNQFQRSHPSGTSCTALIT